MCKGKGTVTISVDRYKEFIAMEARIEAIAAYVNSRDYSVDREVCGAFLNFEVQKRGND